MKKLRDTTLIIGPDYLEFVAELKARVISARVTAARAINREAILLYWDIGCGIVDKQQRLGWGDSVVEMVARDLQRAFPGAKGFSLSSIWRMRQFYLAHNEREFLAQAVRELQSPPSGPQPGSSLPQIAAETRQSGANPDLAQIVRDFVTVVPWGHHVLMLGRMKSPAEHFWYLRATARFGWSRNVLLNQIKAGAYQRAVTEKKTHNFADFYLNLLNDKERGPDDQPSIGIILCAEKDDVEVEYALRTKANPIGVATYQLQPDLPAELKGKLPTAKQLANIVRMEMGGGQ